ncbi:MAG: tyrosine-protein phosphatase [Gammaproteobacteria bacterium]|nr:tyrosine-protein phosphatase [Gammaproteobacteria bacterium]
MNQRHVKLKGACNFRDIGGYTLDSGRNIKTGMIFRSDRLSKLTTSDLRCFEALEIKCIIDLRDEQERNTDPSRLPKTNTPTVNVLSLHNNRTDIKNLKIKMLTGKLGEMDFREFLLSEYRHYINQHDNELKKNI